jgi:hypothetical protein
MNGTVQILKAARQSGLKSRYRTKAYRKKRRVCRAADVQHWAREEETLRQTKG